MSDKRTLTRLKYIHGRFILFGMMFTSLAQGAEKLFVMTSEAIARIASVTVESMMNLTYQTVMRSCYRPGKILFDDRWERMPPGRIRKGKLFERGTKCRVEKDMINGGLKIGPNYFYPLTLYYMLVAFIRPQSLPSAVFRSIG